MAVIYTKEGKQRAAAINLIMKHYTQKADRMNLKQGQKRKFILNETRNAMVDFEKQHGPKWFIPISKSA